MHKFPFYLHHDSMFQLDIDRHNAQYAPIDVETFRLSHDRFLMYRR